MPIMDGAIAPMASPSVMPRLEVYVSQSRYPSSTSSKRDSAQKPISAFRYAGASSRSRAYVGYGSSWISKANGL